MVLWTCGPPGARTTGRVEMCEFRKLIELSTAIASRIACPNSTCPCSDKFASALRASIACNAGLAIDDSAVMNTVSMAALPLPLPLAWVMATRLSLFPRKLCYGRGSDSNFRYDKLLTHFRLCRVVRLFAYTASLSVCQKPFTDLMLCPKRGCSSARCDDTVVWPHR